MAAAEGINWQAVGKPDYSLVGFWFRRFPPDMRNQLNKSEEETLLWTIFYSWYSGYHSGRNRGCASFSQAKMGENIGRSRWTIARALAKFVAWGSLRVIHRRPLGGRQWQTNLYLLSGRLSAVLGAILRQPREKSPCSTFAPQVDKHILKGGSRLPLGAPPPSKEDSDDANERRTARILEIARYDEANRLRGR